MIGLSVVAGAQRQGVGTALMQALCDYADRWMGVLRIELTVYVDNAARDRAVPQVRLRDRGAPPRLRAARRPLRRRVRDGAPASGSAGRGAGGRRRAGMTRIARRRRRRAVAAGDARRGAGARLLSELRRRRQCAGRAERLFLRRGDIAGAGDRHVPRLRRRLRQERPAQPPHARVRRALQWPRHARARRRFADRALREGALHPAQRHAARDAGQSPPRRARRDRLPRRSRRRRRQAHRPDRLVERRQHRALGEQPAPPRRRRGDRSSPPSRSPSIRAARATSSAAIRRRRRC